jgi:type IX secretion system PorP/SprF family membrane protein
MALRFTVFIFSVVTILAHAQQEATYSQYMNNQLAINPAYAGSQEALSATVLARFQNVGLKGAPNTQTFSVHSPLLKKRVSLGMLVIHDQLSVINQTGVHFSYAYRIPVDEKHKGMLSFGLQAGLSMYHAEYLELDVLDKSDPAFSQNIRESRPNIGAGIFYNTGLTYIGLSMPSLLNNVFDRNASFQTVYQAKPIILTAGHVFKLNRMIKLKPNALFKMIDNRPVEFDMNVNALFDEVAWVGVSYKSSKQVVLLTQVQITDQIQFGYSYTISAGKIRTVEVGSHEMMLNYRFKFVKKGVVSPRYF